MTVITKPLTDKKTNQVKEPLVDAGKVQSKAGNHDVEAATVTPKYIILGTRAKRITSSTTLCLFITALLVMSMGVIGGIYIYRQFTRQQFQRFHGWCNVPYGTAKYIRSRDDMIRQEPVFSGSSLAERLSRMKNKAEKSLNEFDNNVKNTFRQEFELDLENESFEKIEVPDLGRGRKGRFIHDFNTNKTGIIDIYGRRCFIMPLNRQRVYPPRMFSDLVKKMFDGFYEVDTEVVRETMEVVLPPIHDFKDIGQYIERECKSLRTYMLKKRDVIVKRIEKRSASMDEPIFAEFAGKKISEVEIDTSPAEEYEKSQLSNA